MTTDLIIMYMIGIMNLTLGISGSLIGLFNFIRNKPVLRLDSFGIEHKKITRSPIPWNEISNADLTNEKNCRVLILKLNCTSSFSAFRSIYKRSAKSYLKDKVVKLNIDQLVIDNSKLISFIYLIDS